MLSPPAVPATQITQRDVFLETFIDKGIKLRSNSYFTKEETNFNFLRELKSTFQLFLPYILATSASRWRTLSAALLVGVDIGAAAALPFLMKQLVELANPAALDLPFGVSTVLGLLLVFLTLDRITHYIQELIFFPVINEAVRHITRRTILQIHRLPWSTYETLSLGSLLSSLKRISQSARLFMRVWCLALVPTVAKLAIAWGTFMVLGLFSVEGMVWLFAGGLLGMGLTVAAGLRWYLQCRRQTWQATDRVTNTLKDSIFQSKIARFFEDTEMQTVDYALQQEAHAWQQTNRRLNLMHMGIGLLMALLTCGTLGGGLYLVRTGQMTLGNFVLLKSQLMAALIPLRSLILECRQFCEAMIDSQRIRHILALPVEAVSQPTSRRRQGLRSTQPAVQFDHVDFAYEGCQPLLQDLCWTVAPGETVVVRGQSGSGKSTLLHLIMGLRQPTRGQVRVFGEDVSTYSRQALGQQVIFIPQDPFLFHQTLRYNLAYGCGEALNDHLLWEAASLMGLEDFLQALPKGLDTIVGEMGMRLSGGERQRLALARALILKPALLILDETTSALDESTERQALDALTQAISTLVIVSHRPTVWPYADAFFDLQLPLKDASSPPQLWRQKDNKPWIGQ